MKNAMRLMMVLTVSFSGACAQEAEKLSADTFEKKINDLRDEQVLDVRTPAEFRKGHLKDAINADINSREFNTMVAALDKAKPVMVYCLSGGRSAKAATYLREKGYQVFELEGGIVKWNATNKPVETTETNSPGMSLSEFHAKLKVDKIVLVDIYAKWCAPCIKMTPWLEDIATRHASKLTLLKINADENPVLLKELKVDALPVLILYNQQKQEWTHVGFLEKDFLDKQVSETLGR